MRVFICFLLVLCNCIVFGQDSQVITNEVLWELKDDHDSDEQIAEEISKLKTRGYSIQVTYSRKKVEKRFGPLTAAQVFGNGNSNCNCQAAIQQLIQENMTIRRRADTLDKKVQDLESYINKLHKPEMAHYTGVAGFASNHIPYFSQTIKDTTGTLVIITNNASNGFSIKANRDKVLVQGSYNFYGRTGGELKMGWSLNARPVAITHLEAANLVAMGCCVKSPPVNSVAVPFFYILNRGDILKPHTDGNMPHKFAEKTIVTIIATLVK